MFVETPAIPYVDNAMSITAADLNVRKRDIARSIDGAGGSEGVPYTNATTIEIHGGLELGGSEPRLLYTERSITRVQTGLIYNTTDGTYAPGLLNIGTGDTGIQMLDRVPNGATITGLTVYHNRVDTGALPTTRVTVALRKRNVVTGVGTLITGPTEDPTAVLASYEAHHAIAITGLSEVVDNTTTVYYLDFTGEAGSNTSTTVLYPCLVTFLVAEQDEAP